MEAEQKPERQTRRFVMEVVDDAMAEVLRRKTPAQRLAIVDSLFRSSQCLIEANIRATHSDWAEKQIRKAVSRRISGATD